MPFFIDVFHGFYRTPIVPTFIDIVPFLINIVPTNNLFLISNVVCLSFIITRWGCVFAKMFLCLFYKPKLYLCSSFSHVCVTDKLDWASVLVTSWIESCHWRAIWENNNQNTKLLYNFNVHCCQSLTIRVISRQQGLNNLRQKEWKKCIFPYIWQSVTQ